MYAGATAKGPTQQPLLEILAALLTASTQQQLLEMERPCRSNPGAHASFPQVFPVCSINGDVLCTATKEDDYIKKALAELPPHAQAYFHEEPCGVIFSLVLNNNADIGKFFRVRGARRGEMGSATMRPAQLQTFLTPWRIRGKSSPSRAVMPRYLSDMICDTNYRKGEDRVVCWGMRMPIGLAQPVACGKCDVRTTRFGACLNEWVPDEDSRLPTEAWKCSNCCTVRPWMHCARCECPLWEPIDDINCRPQEDGKFWCHGCSMRYSCNFTGV